MKGTVQTPKSNIEPGDYPATLKRVHAYLTSKYQSPNEQELSLFGEWELGADEQGRNVTVKEIIRIPRDLNGVPVLNDASKLYERVSSLYGERFRVDSGVDWEIRLPAAYDSVAGLMGLPHFDQRREEGFKPVQVESISVHGVECIGREALVTLVTRGDFVAVKETVPMPKKTSLRRKIEPIADDEELDTLPV